jgi:short-subunit dehydrogenase
MPSQAPAKRPVRDQIVVITGASSGIGRQTALTFAQQGATVVLAARSEAALRELEEQIRRQWGGRALVVVTDVADFNQVQRLADEAVKQFGRIDTWVNDAAVSEYAPFDQVTLEEFRRIMDVNLMGIVHGVKAAFPILTWQRTRSTIINVGSALSDRAVPLQAAYVASKHAIKGFTDTIRMELEHAQAPVDVTLILPSSINTPIFDHARTKLGVKPAPIGPVYEPTVVADAIVYAATHDRVRELFAGASGKFLSVMHKISPRLVDWYMESGGRAFRQQHGREPADPGQEALFSPPERNGRGSVRGRFGERARQSSLYTSYLDPHPAVKGTLFALAVAGAAAGIFALGRVSRPQRKIVIKRTVRPTLKTQIAEDPLFRDLYYPTVNALREQGYALQTVPAFDRLKARFARALAANIGRTQQLPRSAQTRSC